MQTITDAIHWWARVTPGAIALDFGDDRITYREYRDWSDRIAADLIERGLAPGERVGICAGNSLEYCALILGIIRAGGIAVTLNMRYTVSELSEILEDTTPRFVFADDERAAKFTSLDTTCIPLAVASSLRHAARARVVASARLNGRAPLPPRIDV